MKKMKKTKAWTDYPFVELGDIPNIIAPIREVEIVLYDGNKYVDIIVEGMKTSIKAGYIYTQPGRVGTALAFKFPRKHISLYE